jgi:pyruvate ferredoxin oxidoreductase alpha subunit
VIDTQDADTAVDTSLEALVDEHNWRIYALDLRSLANEHGREVMRNTTSVGATAALLRMDLDPFEDLMSDTMGD